jgi:hypothetical protein
MSIALLRIPKLGSLIRGVAVARVTRVLGTLLENGIPLLQAMQTAREAAGHPLLAEALAGFLGTLGHEHARTLKAQRLLLALEGASQQHAAKAPAPIKPVPLPPQLAPMFAHMAIAASPPAAALAAPARMMETDLAISLLATTRWETIQPERTCHDELMQNPLIGALLPRRADIVDDCEAKLVELRYLFGPVQLPPNEGLALVAYTHDVNNVDGSKEGNVYFECNRMLRQRSMEQRAAMMRTWGTFVHYLLRGLGRLPNVVGVVFRA